MMSNIITYLFIGVVWNLILDIASNYLETENRFNFREKLFLGLLWPIMIIIFAYHFFKSIKNG